MIDVGHVLMIEPYIFVEGVGGYRAEYCVAVEPNQTRILNTQPVGRGLYRHDLRGANDH